MFLEGVHRKEWRREDGKSAKYMAVRVRNKVELKCHIDADGCLFCMMKDK